MSRNGVWTAVAYTPSYWYTDIVVVNLSTGSAYWGFYLGTIGPNYGVTALSIANDGTLYAGKFWNETLKFTFNGSGYGSGTQVHNGNNPQSSVTSDDGTKWYTGGYFYNGSTKTTISGGPGACLYLAGDSTLSTVMGTNGDSAIVISKYIGSSWSNTSVTSMQTKNLQGISCSSDASIIVSASGSSTTTVQGVWLSTDGGVTWNRVVSGLANHVCISPDGTNVFATLSDGSVYEGKYA